MAPYNILRREYCKVPYLCNLFGNRSVTIRSGKKDVSIRFGNRALNTRFGKGVNLRKEEVSFRKEDVNL